MRLITNLACGLGLMLLAGCESVTAPAPPLPSAESLAEPTAPTAPSASPGALAITSFSMLEVQYEDSNWDYAPQVEVEETSGAGSVTVTRMSFAMPGIGPLPYATSKCVAPGQRLRLLHEVYGDFELTISTVSASRAPAGNATVEIVFVDAMGRRATITASSPVVQGHFPSTYSNPPLTWDCPR